MATTVSIDTTMVDSLISVHELNLTAKTGFNRG